MHATVTRRGVVCAAAFYCVTASVLPPRASAQPSAEAPLAEAALADEVVPPRLAQPVTIAYPETALGEGASGSVTLSLVISEQGAVQTCEVHASSGRQDFDEAACTALLAAPFLPARRGETPIAARVRFSHRFEPPAPTRPEMAPSESQPPAPEAPPADAPTADEPPEAETATAAEGESYGITAEANASRAQQLRRSAEAVHVVELEDASRQSADLGEVLSRQQGIGVRRAGGLGSTVRFSLNGLTDDQIRFFFDGVPLDWMGFPSGIGDVPVNLVENVEVFRGVVPVRFGADALGGVVNLSAREPAYAPSASVSYQGGSFGTHRLTLDGGHFFPRSGAYVRGYAFLDRADNDYHVTATLSDTTGREYEGRVRRNHDGYEAQGGSVEVGLADSDVADRLSLRAFITDYTKDVQNNVTMEVPYGEVRYGERTSGVVARYENEWDRGGLSAVLAYNYAWAWFTDVSACTYDWFRRCVDVLQPGEVGQGGAPSNQRLYTHSGMLRVTGAYALTDALELRVSFAPTFTSRTGAELADNETLLDPIDLRGDFLTFVAGTELELRAFAERLRVIGFAKYYLQSLWSEVITVPGQTRPIESTFQQPGFGASARLLVRNGVYAKASYEWATRLLRADELFGDGALVYPNLELRPEVSHNANLGLTVEGAQTSFGTFRADVNLFLRMPDRLVVMLGQADFFRYFNVHRARSMGVELAGGYTSPRDYFSLDANLTYQDFRNTSSEGLFGTYDGDRIPNRPFFFSNVTARFELSDLIADGDRLSLSYYVRYVHAFFRNWESVGSSRPDVKNTIVAQLLHTAALSYVVRHDGREITSTLEVSNFTNARAFDFYGIERPGRAVYFKITGEL